jgi:hypothetical protein
VVLADFKSVVPSVSPGGGGFDSHPFRQNFYLRCIKSMVILSKGKDESIKEPIQLLTLNPNLPKELKEERKKIERGNFTSFEDFKKKYKVGK